MPDDLAAQPDVRIRLATVVDLPAINDIYNYYVAHSTCTYQEELEPLAGREAWFVKHGPEHPATVAVDPGGTVVGWGSLSPFHPRSAYRFTVENSIYLRHDIRGRGVGRLMLADLIDRARAIGHHAIIAGIDADQTASIGLHRRLGFEHVGHLKQVGFKFGRWLDVIDMQLMIAVGRGQKRIST
jgi:L-amino acid N-acyltransferase YncA